MREMPDRCNRNFCGFSGKTYVRFLGKWISITSVGQMKLFNFMNCQAVETSRKLDVRQVALTSLFNCF